MLKRSFSRPRSLFYFWLILEQSATLSPTSSHDLALILAPCGRVPFYFFGSRKNVEGGLRSRTLEIRLHAERPRASKKHEAARRPGANGNRRFIVRNGHRQLDLAEIFPVSLRHTGRRGIVWRSKTIREREKDIHLLPENDRHYRGHQQEDHRAGDD